jgi:glycylpeptide N-tetradecanoyltransferase
MPCLPLQEITRRVNLRNIWQAAYTAGVVLPRPVCGCRYWHRSLNPKKLIEVGFSSLAVSEGLHHAVASWRCLMFGRGSAAL